MDMCVCGILFATVLYWIKLIVKKIHFRARDTHLTVTIFFLLFVYKTKLVRIISKDEKIRKSW